MLYLTCEAACGACPCLLLVEEYFVVSLRVAVVVWNGSDACFEEQPLFTNRTSFFIMMMSPFYVSFLHYGSYHQVFPKRVCCVFGP